MSQHKEWCNVLQGPTADCNCDHVGRGLSSVFGKDPMQNTPDAQRKAQLDQFTNLSTHDKLDAIYKKLLYKC